MGKTMTTRHLIAAAMLAATTASIAWADAGDYNFELAGPPVVSGAVTTVKVRLIHLPDKKPIADAVIFETRFDMGPDGMPTMTAPARALPDASETGVYVFEVEPSMAGQWALTVAAKVQGEDETVRGNVTITTPK
jgi:hypothetical protein